MRNLLLAGALAPVLYFVTVAVASATWPGYDHATQYVSELGSAAAPQPWLFNSGILATGVSAVLGSIGVALYFRREGRKLSGLVAAAALLAWGIGMLFGGWFAMPDPRHNGYGLTLGVVLLAPALLVALRGRAGRSFGVFLIAWALATMALLAILFGVGSLVTRANVGLWQRGLAMAMIPGIGIACLILMRRAGRRPEARQVAVLA